jgi:hypothetical protein
MLNPERNLEFGAETAISQNRNLLIGGENGRKEGLNGMFASRIIEVRGFKWAERPTSVARACLLGEGSCGRRLGIAKGSPGRRADRSRAGVFENSFVQVVPAGAFGAPASIRSILW